MVDPGLDRARRAEVVQRQAEQHRVGALDLVDQRDAARRPLLERVVGERIGVEVAVGDRAAGVQRAPAVGGAR